MDLRPAYRDLAIGVTALIGVAGLITIMLLFGELRTFTEHTYGLTYRLNTGAGLVRGSRVTLNGVPIGQIEMMTPVTFPEPGVVVTVKVNEGAEVPRAAEVAIQVGLLGEGSLALTSPVVADRSTPPEYLKPGDTVVATASTIFDQFSKLLEGKLGDLNRAAVSVTELSQTYTSVGKRVGELLAPRTISDVDAGREEPNIASVIARLDASMAGAQAWLTDTKLRDDTKGVVTRFRDLMAEASDTVASIKAAAGVFQDQTATVGGKAQEALDEVRGVSDRLTVALDDAHVALQRLIEGQGSAGQLLNNPDLYRSLTDAARQLERTLEDGQLLIQKWKAEGLPLHF